MNLQIHCDYVVPVHRWNSTDELPRHGHSGNISSASLIGSVTDTTYDGSYALFQGYTQSTSGIISMSGSTGRARTGSQATQGLIKFNVNATHSHNVTISSIGNEQSHENRQPYIAIYRFRRIS